MRFSLLALFVIVGQGPAREPDALIKDLDNLTEQSRKLWKVPGCAVVVVKEDRTLLLKGYGVKEAGKTDAVTPDTIFGIGSLTKAVAATALAKLVEEDKVGWDDRVRKHVRFFRLKDELAD